MLSTPSTAVQKIDCPVQGENLSKVGEGPLVGDKKTNPRPPRAQRLGSAVAPWVVFIDGRREPQCAARVVLPVVGLHYKADQYSVCAVTGDVFRRTPESSTLSPMYRLNSSRYRAVSRSCSEAGTFSLISKNQLFSSSYT